MLKWCSNTYDFKFVSLRYFNASGADDNGEIGEDHKQETHLIPIILQVPLGKRDKIMVFGDDYKTKDGTCIRDYIHVTDLASAHIKSIEYLENGGKSDFFNLGSGKGYSVMEVIDACRNVTGHKIPHEITNRRNGDPPILIACSIKAEKILKWERKYDSIESIVKSAWKWHLNNKDGFN